MASLIGILFVLLIIALVIAIILTVMEKITKIAIPIIIIALLIVGAFYFIYDTADLQRKFETENKLFLLELDDSVAGAFSVKGSQEPVVMDDLSNYRSLSQKSLDALAARYYKVIIVHWNTFDDLPSINVAGITVTREDALAAFESGSPKEFLSPQVASLFPTEDSVRSSLFNLMFGAAYQKTNLIEMYRAGTVDIYPETMGLKVIKLIPEVLLEKLVK
ncbi:hypothetical protein KY338_05165 [Candidatus Woesearchaeota archaeon]|nr:hypothetical protein [Candidatus Woesearchaeota archaeon]MBW3005540.1 hypothetical protein [Candidatus Woesearchaeota archaeon]